MFDKKQWQKEYGPKYYRKNRDKMIADAKVRMKRRKARIRLELAAAAGIDLADKMSIAQGARMLGVPRTTLWQWINGGMIRLSFHFTPGGKRFLYRSEVEAVIRETPHVH